MAHTVTLETYEIEALIAWHRDEQWKAAEKEDYSVAKGHKESAERFSDLIKPASA